MGLADLVNAGIAMAKALTPDFQATVQHKARTGYNANAEPAYANPATPRQAVVAKANELVTLKDGRQVVARTRITFLEAVAVDLEDEIALPDGTKPPIRKVNGGVLSSTGAGFVTEVLCD